MVERPRRSSLVTKSWLSHTWSVKGCRIGLIQTLDHCSSPPPRPAGLCCPGSCLPHSPDHKGTQTSPRGQHYLTWFLSFTHGFLHATPSQIVSTLRARNISLTSLCPAFTSVYTDGKVKNDRSRCWQG